MNPKQFIITIICFLFGMGITAIGALLKIIHFEIGFFTGNILLSIATIFKLIAVILAIVKLIKVYRA